MIMNNYFIYFTFTVKTCFLWEPLGALAREYIFRQFNTVAWSSHLERWLSGNSHLSFTHKDYSAASKWTYFVARAHISKWSCARILSIDLSARQDWLNCRTMINYLGHFCNMYLCTWFKLPKSGQECTLYGLRGRPRVKADKNAEKWCIPWSALFARNIVLDCTVLVWTASHLCLDIFDITLIQTFQLIVFILQI